MEEVTKDLNNSQSVAGSDLTAQPVTAQDLSQPVTGTQVETLADGDDKDKKTVKYTEFEKVNERAKTAEQKLDQAVQQNQVLYDQINLTQAGQANQQAVQPTSLYDQAKADLGLTDEEYLTEAQRSQVNSRMFELQGTAYQQQAQMQVNRQFILSHADYGEVVGRQVGKNFQPSTELTEILNKKPHLAAAAQTPEGAYMIVMEERGLKKLQQQNTVNEEHLNQNQIDTKLAPVSGAAAAGGAVSNTAVGAITIQQQQENERRVANGEFN